MFLCLKLLPKLHPPTIPVRCCHHLRLLAACHSLLTPGPVLEAIRQNFPLEEKSASIPRSLTFAYSEIDTYCIPAAIRASSSLF